MNGSAVLTQSALSSQHVDHVLDRTGSGQIPDRGVFIGVDTHQLPHHAAVIDPHHARLAHREFPATATGYRDLSRWAGSHGRVLGIGVESTGSYGAGLTRHLLTTMPGVEIFEV